MVLQEVSWGCGEGAGPEKDSAALGDEQVAGVRDQAPPQPEGAGQAQTGPQQTAAPPTGSQGPDTTRCTKGILLQKKKKGGGGKKPLNLFNPIW